MHDPNIEMDGANTNLLNEDTYIKLEIDIDTGIIINYDTEQIEAALSSKIDLMPEPNASTQNNDIIIYELGEVLEFVSCNICCQIFKGLEDLKKHLQSSFECRGNTKDENLLQENTKLVSYVVVEGTSKKDEEEADISKEPNKVVTQIQRYYIGIKNTFKCISCSKLFAYRRNLIEHRKTHHKTKERHHRCETCNKGFFARYMLVEHTRIHTGEKPFTCEVCDRKFSRQSHFRKHKRLHNGDRTYFCEPCNRSFTQKSSLVDHLRKHTGERPFACDICSKTFTSKSVLCMHKRIHFPNSISQKSNLYSCRICFKSCSRQNLIKHENSHYGIKNFCCHICGSLFTTKQSLSDHLRIHSQEKPFQCDVCNKIFAYKGSLRAHVRLHTGERPYGCDLCSRTFNHSNHLIHHKRTHTGEKPFACMICDKRFPQKIRLVEHVRTHTGETPFNCSLCTKSFATKSAFNKHKKLHLETN